MVNVICPFCCMSNTVSESLVGSSVQCRQCGAKFTAEHPTEAAAGAPVAKVAVSPEQKRVRKRKIGRYLAVIAGVAALLLVYIFIIHPMIFYGLPRWTKHYLSQDTVMVFYIDVDELNNSKLAQDIGDTFATDTLTNSYIFGSSISEDKIKDMLLVVDMPAEQQFDMHAVIRLSEDMSLSDATGDSKGRKESYEGIEYIEVPAKDNTEGQTAAPQFVAKLEECIFCAAESEEHLKKIIKQVKEKKGSPLRKELQEALAAVSDEDSFLGVYAPENSAISGSNCKGVGLGFTVDSSFTIAFATVFTEKSKAKEAYDSFREMKKFISEVTSKTSDEASRIAAKMFADMDISCSGRTLCIEVDISGDDMRKMIALKKDSGIPFAGEGDSKNLKEMLDNFRNMLKEQPESDGEPASESDEGF